MSCPNPLNIYFGQDALKKYYEPDNSPPLPLVEIPGSLNPFYDDGVRIYAKMMTMLPAHNVKALPGKFADAKSGHDQGTAWPGLITHIFVISPSTSRFLRGSRRDNHNHRIQFWLYGSIYVNFVPSQPRHT